jgi:serine/alanine adding enzyme
MSLPVHCDSNEHSVRTAAAPDAASDGPVSVSLVDEASACDWDSFVESTPTASVYHRYAWRQLVCSLFAHEAFYFAARDLNRTIVGVLPLIRLKSLLFGDLLVSLPYFNYGGLVAQSTRIAEELLSGAVALAQRIGVAHIELRHNRALSVGLMERTDKVAMLRRLPGTGEALWKELPGKLRSQIKRPLREGASCVIGGAELLDEFYRVFAENMRDLGTPVYPRGFFAAILAALPAAAAVAVIRLDGAPVAAGFLIEHRNVTEIPWASSLRRANRLGVNMLLYWNVLERAVSRGSTVFDFGRSTLDGGTFQFKRQWGAEPLQLHWHYWLRAGTDLPRLNPSNPKYRLAVALWRRLPLPVANWLGPHLVKNLP